ncbi:hypothetical protein Tco_1238680, partial [Tanacetum coccineum]
TMTTRSQGMSVEKIEEIVAKRVANAIYESINQAKQRENKVAGNASNKRKLEGVIFTTLASVQKNVAIENRGVTKQEIVESQSRERNKGHYKSNCPIVKFQNRVNMYWKGKAHGDSRAATSNINI